MFSPDDLLFLPSQTDVLRLASGGFARRVFVLASIEPQQAGNRDFLIKILAAANINLEKDTLYAETPATETVSFLSVLKEKQAEHILVFGFSPEAVGLSIETPLYVPFDFYGATWLFAESLPVLEPDKGRKGLLWRALQQLFL